MRNPLMRDPLMVGQSAQSPSIIRTMRSAVLAFVVAATAAVSATKIDITPQDIERALVIARSREADRDRFHAPYIQAVNTPFLEQAELVTETRRVVLLAEERASKGDRFFGYSVSRASDALKVWRRRLSVIARIRFHPQNNYVTAPPIEMRAIGNERALIGVRSDPVYALAPGRKGEFVPVLGAVAEGSFDADALGQALREFVISMEGRELGRVTFNLAALD
jgi:hypothetical protein